MAFRTPLDIVNRTAQHCQLQRIVAFGDPSPVAQEINAAYDQLRLAELTRHTWAFSIRKARCRAITLSTQLYTPPTWAVGTAYTIGNVVNYTGSTYGSATLYPWIMENPTSTGEQPDISTSWQHYFGPLTCDVFDNEATYAAGELALVPETWLVGSTYPNAAIINYQGTFYVSLAGTNVGNTPSSTVGVWWAVWVSPESVTLPVAGTPISTSIWSSATTYAKSALVQYTSLVTGNTLYYISLVNSNTNNEPDTSPSDWQQWGSTINGGVNSPLGPFTYTAFNGGVQIYLSLKNQNGPIAPALVTNMPFSGSTVWTLIGGTIKQLTVVWPEDTGPTNQVNTLNLFRLPFGWLRPADRFDQGPKHPWLGALFGNMPWDLNYRDRYFTAFGSGPFDIPFVADVADVARMAPNFCECLALRMGIDLSGPLTLDEAITAKCERLYKRVTSEALRIDAILQGDPTQDMEEFLRVRN